jgi:hypothetical protein
MSGRHEAVVIDSGGLLPQRLLRHPVGHYLQQFLCPSRIKEFGRREYRHARGRRNPELRLAAPAAILELFGQIRQRNSEGLINRLVRGRALSHQRRKFAIVGAAFGRREQPVLRQLTCAPRKRFQFPPFDRSLPVVVSSVARSYLTRPFFSTSGSNGPSRLKSTEPSSLIRIPFVMLETPI